MLAGKLKRNRNLLRTLRAFLVESARSFLPKTSTNIWSASFLAAEMASSTIAVGFLPYSLLSMSNLFLMLFSVSSWSMIDDTLALINDNWLSFSPSTFLLRKARPACKSSKFVPW